MPATKLPPLTLNRGSGLVRAFLWSESWPFAINTRSTFDQNVPLELSRSQGRSGVGSPFARRPFDWENRSIDQLPDMVLE